MKKLNPIKIIVIAVIIFLCVLSITIFISPEYFLSIEKEKYIASQNLLGESQYLSYCASCHGATGAGNGPSAITLARSPPNFLNRHTQFINGFHLEGIQKTINEGISNSQMPKFNYLPEEVKKSIVEYLITLRENVEEK